MPFPGRSGYRINNPDDVVLHRTDPSPGSDESVPGPFVVWWSRRRLLMRGVFAVREKDKEEIVTPPDFAVTLDEAWADPVYVQALERLNKVPSGDRPNLTAERAGTT